MIDRDRTVNIMVGATYVFFSTLQGIDGAGIYPCLYSGQHARVLMRVEKGPGAENETTEDMYRVRFPDGAVTSVWEGEINGYFFNTGQFHGPLACEVRAHDKPANFEINNRRRA